MLRAAGDYVRASEDLRPRVLEAARAQCGEQRARRFIRHAAVCVVLLASFMASVSQVPETAGADQEVALNAADSRTMFSRAQTYAARGDIGWGMVKAFTELRCRQSAAFRL
jgi:hypothetical protein